MVFRHDEVYFPVILRRQIGSFFFRLLSRYLVVCNHTGIHRGSQENEHESAQYERMTLHGFSKLVDHTQCLKKSNKKPLLGQDSESFVIEPATG